MGTGSCAVCGSAVAHGHACSMVAGVAASRSSWFQRLRGRKHYFGRILRSSGARVWACEHKHSEEGEALRCAQTELGLRQDPDSPVDLLMRPQMPRFGETAGFHAPVPGLSGKAWDDVKEIFHGRCRYCGCGGALEREHRTPMSRDGANRIRNIVPACRQCNSAKASATEQEYLDALRLQWGKRVPRSPRNLDQRLGEIERRYAKEIRQERGETLLRSVEVPARAWVGVPVPSTARLAVHRDQTHKLAGVSFHSSAVEIVLHGRDRWEGRVALIPQPDNRHDPHAVAVFVRGNHVGYLPAPVARQVHTEIMSLLRHERTATLAKLELFRWEKGLAGKTYLALPFRTRTA